MIGNLFKYTSQFAQKGVFLCYSGPTSHEVLVSTGNTLKQFLISNNIYKKKHYCIFSIYVELFENIIRYGVDCFHSEIVSNHSCCPYGIISVSTDGNQFTIQSGNIITYKQGKKLNPYLYSINLMDPQMIRDFYREKRKHKCEPDCKGAGLGLIEIVRKSSQPISFSFEKIDDTFLFYTLTAVI
ncbi:hypothetical protein MHK_001614 [Candidatus Magnetomorum sp. HK-1]|nr:hypothetical protein MHK_001614 [Candidatus Magnetomorum sp. HK-1]